MGDHICHAGLHYGTERSNKSHRDLDDIFADAENLPMMAEKTCLLIENAELRKEMGKLAKDYIIKYSTERIMAMWVNLFNELCEKHQK